MLIDSVLQGDDDGVAEQGSDLLGCVGGILRFDCKQDEIRVGNVLVIRRSGNRH